MNRKMIMRLFVLTLAFLFSAAKTYALDIPNRPDGYVHDQEIKDIAIQ